MTGYRMAEEEATRDLAAVRRLPPVLDPERSLEPWEVTLAGIRVRSAVGIRRQVGEFTAEFCRRPLLVSDVGMRRAGHLDTVLDAMTAAGLDPVVVDGVEENPSAAFVEASARRLADDGVDGVVALGGGSVLDAAKGIHLILTQGGRMQDYWGYGKATAPMLPSLALPTTAGTGSEAQAYAVLSDPDSGRKMACGATGARYRTVLLDPELLASAPADVAAAAALDALSHAVESLVSRAANSTSKALSTLAYRLLEPAVTPALSGDLQALAQMALGAHLAGAAIEQSMLGATHAAANPLTARCGVRHGVAVGLLLPAVVRFNAPTAETDYAALVASGSVDDLVQRLRELGEASRLPPGLRSLGVGEEQLSGLAALADDEWTGDFNPRPVAVGDFEELYRAVL